MANNGKQFNGDLDLNFNNFTVCNVFENIDKNIKIEVRRLKDGYKVETFCNGEKTNERAYLCELILLDKLNELMN